MLERSVGSICVSGSPKLTELGSGCCLVKGSRLCWWDFELNLAVEFFFVESLFYFRLGSCHLLRLRY